MPRPTVLFVAGDLSADAHAARAARHIRSLRPAVRIVSLGGPALKAVSDDFLGDLVSMGVMGFWEPIKKIPRFISLLKNVVEPAIQKYKPDVVVPVDFYGFNRHVAETAKKAGARVVYFISPQVWASRAGRVATLKKWVDEMLVIFPFEEKIYHEAGLAATFVGHPLLDAMPAPAAKPERLEPVIGLLPGSRAGVVARHVPLFLKAAELISKKIQGSRFVLFAAESLSNEFYDRLIKPHGALPYLLEIVRDENYEWRRGLDLALTTSGTATLENALLGVPMAVVYKTSWPTYWLARMLVKVKNIAIVNILAGHTVVPELIQADATPENLAAAAQALWTDRPRRRLITEMLLALRAQLGGPGGSERAARRIAEHLG
jgi:lipid-A-disaccharide synthase